MIIDWKALNASKGLESLASVTPKAPMAPDEFRQKLEQANFTNGRSDRKIVAQLYEDTFHASCQQVQLLSFEHFSDAEFKRLLSILRFFTQPELSVQIDDETYDYTALSLKVSGGMLGWRAGLMFAHRHSLQSLSFCGNALKDLHGFGEGHVGGYYSSFGRRAAG